VTDRTKIQLLHVNSFQTIKLETNETRMYQIEGYYDFIFKIIRRNGYPYFYTQKCELNAIKECEEAFVGSTDIGKQLVKKNEEFSEEPCKSCMYFFKFYAVEPCAVVLHLNTLNS
jgi:hypothetical protein